MRQTIVVLVAIVVFAASCAAFKSSGNRFLRSSPTSEVADDEEERAPELGKLFGDFGWFDLQMAMMNDASKQRLIEKWSKTYTAGQVQEHLKAYGNNAHYKKLMLAFVNRHSPAPMVQKAAAADKKVSIHNTVKDKRFKYALDTDKQVEKEFRRQEMMAKLAKEALAKQPAKSNLRKKTADN